MLAPPRMSSLARTLRFVNLLCAALLAGGLIMVVLALRPGLHRLPLSAAVRAHQIMMARANLYMPACGVLSALTAVAVAAMRRQVSPRSAALYRWGVACTATVGVTTALFVVPIDRAIAKWEVATGGSDRSAQITLSDALPADHLEVWRRWDTYNAVRTAASLLALSLYVIANMEARGREAAS